MFREKLSEKKKNQKEGDEERRQEKPNFKCPPPDFSFTDTSKLDDDWPESDWAGSKENDLIGCIVIAEIFCGGILLKMGFPRRPYFLDDP